MAGAALACALAGGAPALAQDDLAQEAELEFELGIEAYDRGRYREALLHYLGSNRLVPNPSVVFQHRPVLRKARRPRQRIQPLHRLHRPASRRGLPRRWRGRAHQARSPRRAGEHQDRSTRGHGLHRATQPRGPRPHPPDPRRRARRDHLPARARRARARAGGGDRGDRAAAVRRCRFWSSAWARCRRSGPKEPGSTSTTAPNRSGWCPPRCRSRRASTCSGSLPTGTPNSGSSSRSPSTRPRWWRGTCRRLTGKIVVDASDRGALIENRREGRGVLAAAVIESAGRRTPDPDLLAGVRAARGADRDRGGRFGLDLDVRLRRTRAAERES